MKEIVNAVEEGVLDCERLCAEIKRTNFRGV